MEIAIDLERGLRSRRGFSQPELGSQGAVATLTFDFFSFIF